MLKNVIIAGNRAHEEIIQELYHSGKKVFVCRIALARSIDRARAILQALIITTGLTQRLYI